MMSRERLSEFYYSLLAYCANIRILSWRDPSLTWALIAAITDDPLIKQGLFPSPGANVSTSKGGGKPKTDHHYAVALAIFGEHDVYKDTFALAKGPKEKAVWGKKVKNRIQT